MKPYLLYIFIGLVFLSLIRGTLKIDRNGRLQRASRPSPGPKAGAR